MATISVDIDTSDIYTDDLINELCKRAKKDNIDKEDKEKLRLALGFTKSGAMHGEQLDLILKKELFEEAASKYSLVELQRRLA